MLSSACTVLEPSLFPTQPPQEASGQESGRAAQLGQQTQMNQSKAEVGEEGGPVFRDWQDIGLPVQSPVFHFCYSLPLPIKMSFSELTGSVTFVLPMFSFLPTR